MSYQVTVASSADLSRLAELLNDLFSIELDFTADATCQERGLALLLAEAEKSDRVTVVVVRDDAGTAIGMATAQLVISTAEGAPSAWIEDVVVHPEHRRQGIGKLLLDHLVAWAQERGATRAQLAADTENPNATLFYESLGWQSTQLGLRRRFIN